MFIDQSAIYLGAIPLRTIVPADESPTIATPVTTYFPPRVVVIGGVAYGATLPLQIMTPDDRKRLGIKGWRKRMVLDWMRVCLAPSINALGVDGMVVVADKALRIRPADIVDAVRAGGCSRVRTAWLIPTAAAKLVSPLDNTLWHEYKERVRKRLPTNIKQLRRALLDEWQAIDPEHIRNYYRHCALTRTADARAGLH